MKVSEMVETMSFSSWQISHRQRDAQRKGSWVKRVVTMCVIGAALLPMYILPRVN
jgi:hypothetical protein